MGVPKHGGGYHEASGSDPAVHYVAATLGTAFAVPARVLLVETEGRLNVTRVDGTVVENVPVQAGYNPLVCTMVAAPTVGTAAAGVFALS